MDQLITAAAQNGIWSLLFVVSSIYFLKRMEKNQEIQRLESEKREEALRQTISENQKIILAMTEKLEILNHLKTDVDIILECLTCPPGTKEKRGELNGEKM